MKSSRSLPIAVFGGFLGVLGPGCEVVLGDLPTGTSTETETTGTATTSSLGGAGGSATSTSTAGQGGTTTSSSSTSSSSTTSTTDTACCDCDGDNHDAVSCGGDDCDDNDPTTYPGADYQTEPTKQGGFDHDCSKTVDPDPALYKVVKCGIIGLPCAQKQGFLDSIPPCGMPGDWGTCQGSVLPCSNQVLEPGKKLACK